MGNIKSLSLSIFPPLGAVALDSPQDPVPVSSVSLIPPPPPKNAARMLALALAESAQQASAHSHKRPGDAHAESTNYGEAEAGTALEKLHLSAGAPDKLHLFTALPENRLHFQSGAALEQDCQGTAGEQNHPPGAPGGQEPPTLHTGVPGDTPGSRDAEQEQSSFHPSRAGDKAHVGGWEHTALHGPGAVPERELPGTELPVEQPHPRAGLAADKLHAPCTAEDKLQSPSVGPAGDKGTPGTVPYLSTLPSTAAEPRAPPGAAPQADAAVPPAPRAAPAPRQEHQAAVGQVPAAKAPGGSGQVRAAPCTAPLKC